jgi:hypothetical protein
MADIRIGVDRIRKLKFEHAKSRTEVGRARYSMANPPDVFVRKALESSDEECDDEPEKGKGKVNGKNRRYKMNGNRSRKPRLNNDDFPELR